MLTKADETLTEWGFGMVLACGWAEIRLLVLFYPSKKNLYVFGFGFEDLKDLANLADDITGCVNTLDLCWDNQQKEKQAK